MFSSGARTTGDGRILVDRAKPYAIPKREVWEAYKRVRANQGAAGIDDQTIADFEADLTNNLYKLWNRLASGSYFPAWRGSDAGVTIGFLISTLRPSSIALNRPC